MSIVLKKFTNVYFASCPKGLENVLEKELISLGAKSTKLSSRGVEFKISKEEVINIVLYSRIASRLFLKFFDFDIKKEKDIYLGLRSINWPSFFKVDQKIKVQFTQGVSEKLKKKSAFNNTKYLSFVAKDAIVDRFMKDVKDRPSVDLQEPDVLINCHLLPNDNPDSKKERLTVLIDLLGETLCHRGYRSSNQAAPVRENLAAGILDLLDWKPESERFIDLTCGSGTFLFEAVIKKYKIPAKYEDVIYLAKNPDEKIWNFQKYKFLDSISRSKEFKNAIKEGFEKIVNLEKVENKDWIVGNDIKFRTLETLNDNIYDLSWEKIISTRKVNALDFNEFSEDQNFMFCNPPYGERIGEIEQLKTMYFELGENFKQNYKKSRWSLISSNKDLLKKIRLKAHSKHPVSHGSLDCLVYEYRNF